MKKAMQQTTKQTAQPDQLNLVIDSAGRHVSLTPTEVRAWRLWWPQATVSDILLIRQRNGGRLHTIVNNTYPNNGCNAA